MGQLGTVLYPFRPSLDHVQGTSWLLHCFYSADLQTTNLMEGLSPYSEGRCLGLSWKSRGCYSSAGSPPPCSAFCSESNWEMSITFAFVACSVQLLCWIRPQSCLEASTLYNQSLPQAESAVGYQKVLSIFQNLAFTGCLEGTDTAVRFAPPSLLAALSHFFWCSFSREGKLCSCHYE